MHYWKPSIKKGNHFYQSINHQERFRIEATSCSSVGSELLYSDLDQNLAVICWTFAYLVFFMLEERKMERKSMQKLPRKLSKICIQVWILKKNGIRIWTETKRHGFSTLHGIQSPTGKMLLHQSENWNKMNSYNYWNTTLFTVVSLFRCWVCRWAQSWTNWRQTPWWRKYA